ncbi:hypothetical protein PILCRDRAFT_13994 [Piloderma croceum F 1598]|uniref:Uncharacterized protein n=1 Tax=Piloderma croceum (strain F 1598) TaxID=765440 RepID=A0A0C3F4E7_PILCF|nr:hypothetical protein PILCRDRAFT_13994 [Piloderma croceum F 1598]
MATHNNNSHHHHHHNNNNDNNDSNEDDRQDNDNKGGDNNEGDHRQGDDNEGDHGREPSLIPTGRKNEQSPSGLSTLSLQRSERSIPLNYPSSEPRISSISVMRIWQSTPMDLSYTQLVEDEERSHGESLGITSVSSTFTSTPSPLIDLSLSPCRKCMLWYQTI